MSSVADYEIGGLQERAEVRDYYARYRFAFPKRDGDVVAEIEELERRHIRRLVDRVPVLLVRHPAEPDADAVGAAIARYCP
jgi:hypothetical protein